jgi:riboflavin biosynthesis pyrimidine reductase
VSPSYQNLAASSAAVSAANLIEQLGLGAAAGEGKRPRLVAAMIASADGRAAVDGRAGGLGGPADRAVLRELRCNVDAILIGPTTLIDERYSTLLDSDHRERRIAAGLPAEPIAATISRRLNPQLAELELFGQQGQRIVIYTESDEPIEARGAELSVARSEPGELTLAGCLEDLYANHGVRTLLSEGGPTLLRALAEEHLIDDFIFTVSPLLVAGSAPTLLSGEAFEPPLGLALENVWRSESFLFLHYTRQR